MPRRKSVPDPLDPHERAMLNFARSWAPFGGGDDEIFHLFGIPISVFYRRVLALLDKPRATRLDAPTSEALKELCARKLA
ncbi:DUF3263 domain-containing protein [Rhodococcus sp. IEGM 1351]|uniref:DUF3263 domain-containing protein n=1 Tax=Rhodococcus sp. IEGM 1351 TaxID=3047089 RepID=UPI00120537A2|nr:DUF3263 domain-containing protein [Rhodococcus sp. IEGM 1351]MDI9939217.1 DUF3263 domain-containing protein [Rhodococcus sp. IEGM 1351]RZL63145.1 MAG: DUF3263 domain-containing protein [Rhodococcus sp. (in: high G+C Gram-positive bacteria)]